MVSESTECNRMSLKVAYSIDATEDNGTMGRLVNHSKSKSNVYVKAADGPKLHLVAKRDISTGNCIIMTLTHNYYIHTSHMTVKERNCFMTMETEESKHKLIFHG